MLMSNNIDQKFSDSTTRVSKLSVTEIILTISKNIYRMQNAVDPAIRRLSEKLMIDFLQVWRASEEHAQKLKERTSILLPGTRIATEGVERIRRHKWNSRNAMVVIKPDGTILLRSRGRRRRTLVELVPRQSQVRQTMQPMFSLIQTEQKSEVSDPVANAFEMQELSSSSRLLLALTGNEVIEDDIPEPSDVEQIIRDLKWLLEIGKYHRDHQKRLGHLASDLAYLFRDARAVAKIEGALYLAPSELLETKSREPLPGEIPDLGRLAGDMCEAIRTKLNALGSEQPSRPPRMVSMESLNALAFSIRAAAEKAIPKGNQHDR